MGHDRLGYRRELDGLRGIAIAVVVGYHLGWPGFSGGFVGVDLFFVLSGFLITRLAVDEITETGGFNLGAFYRRRVDRLAPALVAVAVVCAAALPFLPVAMQRETAWSLVGTATYSTNWMKASGFAAEGSGLLWQSWSLAVEEQFYLLWPTVLWWASRRRVNPIAVAVTVAVGAVVVRAVGSIAGWSWEVLYYSTFTRIDGIMVGCVLGLLPTLPALSRRFVGSAGVLLGVIVVGVPHVSWNVGWVLTASTVASAVVLVGTLDRAPTVLVKGWLVRLGRLSYGLYLWHQPVFKLGRHLVPQQSAAYDVVMVAVSWALTEATWRIVERRSHKPERGQEVAHVRSKVQRPT